MDVNYAFFDDREYWREVQFVLNDGTTFLFRAPDYTIHYNERQASYTVPSGHEIVGFQMRSRTAVNECTNNVINVFHRFDCSTANQ